MNINVLVLEGRLTRDPKNMTKDGTDKTMAAMSIAVPEREKEGAEWVEKPIFVDFVVFGGVADACLKRLKKGSKVGIAGRLGIRNWESGGKAGTSISCKNPTVSFLDPITKTDSEEAPF